MTPATASSRRFAGDFRADVLVMVVIAAALVGAYAYRLSLFSQTRRVADPSSGFSVSIPSYWKVDDELPPDTFISAYDTRADSVYKSAITAQSFAIDPENPAQLDDIVTRRIERQGEELLGHHLLDLQPITIAGAEARAIQYAYVARPIDEPFMASPPVVVMATDYVIYTGDEYWILTLTADEKILEKEARDFDNIIRSIALP